MGNGSQQEVTTLLIEIHAGQKEAEDRLAGLVYDELRRIASSMMRRERPDHTLQATALVHEAFVRLIEQDTLNDVENRAYLFGVLTRVMRQVLVDHARRRDAEKRGGKMHEVGLESVVITCQGRNLDILALDEALKRLASMNSRQCDVVTRRFFAGLPMREIADQLGVSVATVEKDFRIARNWLHGQLMDDGQG